MLNFKVKNAIKDNIIFDSYDGSCEPWRYSIFLHTRKQLVPQIIEDGEHMTLGRRAALFRGWLRGKEMRRAKEFFGDGAGSGM